MKLEQYLGEIEKFLQQYLKDAHAKGYVLGISGGIDSALVAALSVKAVGNDKLFALLMPIDSHPSDLKDGIDLCHKFNIAYEVVDLSEAYHLLVKNYGFKDDESSQLALYNTKVRLRMVTLYAFAQARNSLVLGTDNADEIHVGYFTKYGDGAADLVPLAELTKGEVFQASKMLGVPDSILKRIPTAGLFIGQTDEKELGVTYAELDDYLLGKEIKQKAKERIQYLHRVSEHKRNPIPRPVKYNRNSK
ncbi:MAG: NAD(+) synthase [Bacilli bacterium]|jgi:NAD+ synthase|nr:NAD(+) synthase [Bacilli bacterium]